MQCTASNAAAPVANLLQALGPNQSLSLCSASRPVRTKGQSSRLRPAQATPCSLSRMVLRSHAMPYTWSMPRPSLAPLSRALIVAVPWVSCTAQMPAPPLQSVAGQPLDHRIHAQHACCTSCQSRCSLIRCHLFALHWG